MVIGNPALGCVFMRVALYKAFTVRDQALADMTLRQWRTCVRIMKAKFLISGRQPLKSRQSIQSHSE